MMGSRMKKFVVAGILTLFIAFPISGIPFSGTALALTAEEYFQQGKSSLEQFYLFSAHSSFQNALNLDPNHQGTNLFYALTRILMISNSTDFNILLDRAGVSPSGRDIFNWTADFTRDPTGKVLLPPNSPTGAELQTFLKNNILPEINGALNNLSKVGSSYETIFKWRTETGSGMVNIPNTLTNSTKLWQTNEWGGGTNLLLEELNIPSSQIPKTQSP